MALPLVGLPDILTAAGCEVTVYPGFGTRGRPGTFAPRGVTMHHDGSPVGPAKPALNYARFLFEGGRPSEGIPAPLCQAWVDFYGRWWLGAAGRANHAGVGRGWGAIGKDMGNSLTFGVEMDNTVGEPTTSDQYLALHTGLPAIFNAYGWDPATALTAHKEYAAGRKSDPDDIDMPTLRRDVTDLMGDAMPTADQIAEAVWKYQLGTPGSNVGIGPAGAGDWLVRATAEARDAANVDRLTDIIKRASGSAPVQVDAREVADRLFELFGTDVASDVAARLSVVAHAEGKKS